VELSFFGGVGEIGGNKILLQDGKTWVFLDFGLSFSQLGSYYDAYLHARGFAAIDEYVSLGLLPNVSGLYREDLLSHVSPSHPLMDGGHGRAAEAVIVSHAHLDHVGMIPYLRPDIHLMGSETTHRILSYLQDTSDGYNSEFCYWYPSFKLVPMKRSRDLKRASRSDVENERVERKYVTLPRGNAQRIGSVEVLAYEVDHSLPGANAYILRTSSGTIAYTGDMRFHGYSSHATNEFVRALENDKVKVLLCEGTRAPEDSGFSEESLKDRLIAVIEDRKNLVLANYPARDTSRILTISSAAKACGRKLLVNPMQAYYLHHLAGCSDASLPSKNDIQVLLPRRGWGIWGNPSYDPKNQREDYSRSYPDEVLDYILEKCVLVTPKEVANAQDQFVVTCSFYELNMLHDLKPMQGSCYVWSLSEPFDDEGVIEYDRVKNWLDHFGLGEPVPMHCSGHMCGKEIEQLIDRVNPEVVVPIHTQQPDLFKKWHKNVKVLQRNGVLQV